MKYYPANRDRVWLKLKTRDLAKLFNVSNETICRWARLGKLDPHSLLDIIDKYNNINMLDKRCTQSSVPIQGD